MDDFYEIPDGLSELRKEMPTITNLIAHTARWVHPETFRALPVWYPEIARGQPIYDAGFSAVLTNKNRVTATVNDKSEPNIKAGKAFVAALGTRRTGNWTVCHIWGVDDPKFQLTNTVVRDPRFYSCVANMVLLPTPLKGFTDAVPEIKRMLRICAYHLYGWACEHDGVRAQYNEVCSGIIPDGYPSDWPTVDRHVLPPNTAPFSLCVQSAIKKRKSELRRLIRDQSLVKFPRAQVEEVLKYWKLEL